MKGVQGSGESSNVLWFRDKTRAFRGQHVVLFGSDEGSGIITSERHFMLDILGIKLEKPGWNGSNMFRGETMIISVEGS